MERENSGLKQMIVDIRPNGTAFLKNYQFSRINNGNRHLLEHLPNKLR